MDENELIKDSRLENSSLKATIIETEGFEIAVSSRFFNLSQPKNNPKIIHEYRMNIIPVISMKNIKRLL